MEMLQISVKEKILKAIATLPADASYEDAFEQLLMLRKIEQGLKEVQDGQSIPQSEVENRIRAKWQT
jgi:hypothetical protein